LDAIEHQKVPWIENVEEIPGLRTGLPIVMHEKQKWHSRKKHKEDDEE
jgi:hypothetical protein